MFWPTPEFRFWFWRKIINDFHSPVTQFRTLQPPSDSLFDISICFSSTVPLSPRSSLTTKEDAFSQTENEMPKQIILTPRPFSFPCYLSNSPMSSCSRCTWSRTWKWTSWIGLLPFVLSGCHEPLDSTFSTRSAGRGYAFTTSWGVYIGLETLKKRR